MKNSVKENCLRLATARLNTLVRFARWSEAKEQSRLVSDLLTQCSDPQLRTLAETALRRYRSEGGFFKQIQFFLTDVILVLLLVAPFYYFFDYAMMAPELSLLVFLFGCCSIATMSATQRGNSWLVDNRFTKALSDSEFSFISWL